MRKLKLVLILTASYLTAQIIGGIMTNSLALLADAGHMFTDAAGLGLSLLAVRFTIKPPTPQRTYGFYRMEILAALANSVLLILVSIYIIYEAFQRLLNPPEIQGLPVILIAAVGLAVNLIGLRILSAHDHAHGHFAKSKPEENLNMQGASMEVLSDALGSIGVIVAGLIIFFTEFYVVDPIISVGLALFILPRTWILLKKSVHILLEGVPADISHEEIKNEILRVKGVTGVFELHIWSITSGIPAVSAHVVIIDSLRSQQILKNINSILDNKFGISHSTIQVENFHQEGTKL
jgi:cobalt-zinc-cadmium efflux system protein